MMMKKNILAMFSAVQKNSPNDCRIYNYNDPISLWVPVNKTAKNENLYKIFPNSITLKCYIK